MHLQMRDESAGRTSSFYCDGKCKLLVNGPLYTVNSVAINGIGRKSCDVCVCVCVCVCVL